MSRRRLQELRGYVRWETRLFAAMLFILAVAAAAFLFRGLHRLLPQAVQHPAWWVLPAAGLGTLLYMRSGRWTGGPGFRDAVRADLAAGLAACHRVRAKDAIEFEEREDEGPVFFVLTDDLRTFAFAGQYLARYRAKGFPWREFEIMEAPRSKVFFGLKPLATSLTPSARHPPLDWRAHKRLLAGVRQYGVVTVDFDALREGRTTSDEP